MGALRWINILLACLAVLAPMAHVLEWPDKAALDGTLWLAVQQHLYRGWGPLIGAPVELGALATTLVLLAMRRHHAARVTTALGASAYGGMVAAFFLFNRPVNNAVNGWTAATLPADWPNYRLQWELGHALAAALSVAALICLLRALLLESDAIR
jgi:hypothetical protein